MSEQGHTILLVDNDEGIRNAVTRLLRKEHYTILTAASGEEGIELFERHPIHLVVSEQMLPGTPGTDFLQRVKERWPTAVRVILSGYVEPALVVESVNKGEIFRFFPKPWVDEELRTGIRQCIAQYELEEENRQLVAQVRIQNEALRRINSELESIVESRTRILQYAQEIVENLPLALIGLSEEEEVILVNEPAQAMLGLPQDFLPGSPACEVLPEHVLTALDCCKKCGEALRLPNIPVGSRMCALYIRPIGRGATRGYAIMLQEETNAAAIGD